jgi:N-methylhydantoinase A
MRGYLSNLQQSVGGNSRVFVMQSSGGITSLATAAREPVRTVLSGPAGGIIGAAARAKASGYDKVISFDMGGTSTDVALIDGAAHATNEGEIAGYPIRVPMLDIHTVGAGGGSIARFDAAGALRVGPESAGADPGPICYGRGTQPTVTDANLLLERLRADRFLGGDFALDLDRTRAVVKEWLKHNRCSMSLQQFAAGVVRVVNSTMERAIRVVSIERGYDPRSFTLVAFGGAGGLHACELASELGIPRVLIPAMPGALSAYGILVSDVVKDFSRTLLLTATAKTFPRQQLETEFRNLSQRARLEHQREQWTGSPKLERSLDLRYRGQGFELNLPYTKTVLTAFHEAHRQRYGYSNPEREVELVTLRLRSRLRTARTQFAKGKKITRREQPVKENVWFHSKPHSTAIVDRETLGASKYKGPAIVTEYSATTIVSPGAEYQLDKAGNLIITLATKQKGRRSALRS